jgi:hypothetical protein
VAPYPGCVSQLPWNEIIVATEDQTCLFKNAYIRGPLFLFVIERMIVVMLDADYISERLSSLRQEMRDIRVFNARYWSHSRHTALDKSYRALRQERLLQVKRDLSDLIQRCA